MRFALFRRFSHLIHRRTRSDPFPLTETPASPLDNLTRSLSLYHIQVQPSRTLDSIIPNSTLSVTPFDLVPLTFTDKECAVPVTQGSMLPPEQLAEMEVGNAELNAVDSTLKLKLELPESVALLKNQIEIETSALATERKMLSDVEEEIAEQRIQIARYERFFAALESMGLEPLVSGPREAIFSGLGFEEALIESLRVAASVPRSPWCTLIPAVIGPRTSSQYDSALRLVSRARQDLHNSRNIARFWKLRAKLDGTNSDLITPSSSQLSDTPLVIDPERLRAANDLLAKLKSGEIPLRGRVVPQASESLPSAEFRSSISQMPSLRSSSSWSTLSIEDIQDMPSSANLAPLASQIFRQQLLACRSKGHSAFTDLRRNSSGSTESNYSSSSDENGGVAEAGRISRATHRASVNDLFADDVYGGIAFIHPRMVSRPLDTITEEESGTELDPNVTLRASDSTSSNSSENQDASANISNDTTLVQESEEPASSPIKPKLPSPTKRSYLPILTKLPRRLSLSMSPTKIISPKPRLPSPRKDSTLSKPTQSSLQKVKPLSELSPPKLSKPKSKLKTPRKQGKMGFSHV